MDDRENQASDQTNDGSHPNAPLAPSAPPRTLPGAAYLFAVLSALWGIINVLGAAEGTRTPAERIERLLEAPINFGCAFGLFKLRKFGLYLAYLTSILFAMSGVSDLLVNPNDRTHGLSRLLIGLAWIAYFIAKRKLFSSADVSLGSKESQHLG